MQPEIPHSSQEELVATSVSGVNMNKKLFKKKKKAKKSKTVFTVGFVDITFKRLSFIMETSCFGFKNAICTHKFIKSICLT